MDCIHKMTDCLSAEVTWSPLTAPKYGFGLSKMAYGDPRSLALVSETS